MSFVATRYSRHFGRMMELTHMQVDVELTCLAGQGPHKPSTDWWAIRCMGRCLNTDNEWEWEPQPSSREDHFLARCRFTLEDALERAERAPSL